MKTKALNQMNHNAQSAYRHGFLLEGGDPSCMAKAWAPILWLFRGHPNLSSSTTVLNMDMKVEVCGGVNRCSLQKAKLWKWRLTNTMTCPAAWGPNPGPAPAAGSKPKYKAS